MKLFQNKTVNISSEDKKKEGWLEKESKYRKIWRNRWCVLTQDRLYTFENEKQYINPTAEIDVTKIKTVKTDESKGQNIFKIDMSEEEYFFRANNFSDKEAWIGAIGKAMIKTSKSNLFMPEN